MHPVILSNLLKIEAVVLTEEEEKAAILEGKRRKWFKERNVEYWGKT